MIRWMWHHLIKWGLDYNFHREVEKIELSYPEEFHNIDMDKSIRISVLPAKGGCVVETRTLDKKNGGWINEAHIIPENEDVAHRVGQIVALELLKR
jgi:hypothetical protein